MRLLKIKTVSHPTGNRIDLEWEFPDAAGYSGVRVMRREGTYPVSPQDGQLVVEGDGITSARDTELAGETVYYYALFPYRNAPPEYVIDTYNRTLAMATSSYNMPNQLFKLLPGIYHRYDTILPSNEATNVSPEDKTRGQLQRFLDLPGYQLDLLQSFTKAITNFHNIDAVDGQLLRLLAQWIGWPINLSLEYEQQRNEIHHAPEIYKTVGILANLRALVNRITNWDCRIKEFVHNVFLSNKPEQLNTWSQSLIADKWKTAEMISIDNAYAGKLSTFRDHFNRMWLFYHSERNGCWNIRYKIYDQGEWSPGIPATNSSTIEKYPCALQLENNNIWLFWSSYESEKWKIKTKILAVGRKATNARLIGENSGPFPIFEGATLVVQIDSGVEITVNFEINDFDNINSATATEVMNILNQRLPGLTASTGAGETIVLASDTFGENSSLKINATASTAAVILGFDTILDSQGENATPAELVSHLSAPYSLSDGDQLMVQAGSKVIPVTFNETDFPEGIGNASLPSVLTVINRHLSSVRAEMSGSNSIRLVSNSLGEESTLAIELDSSTAASALGFGASLPQQGISDFEPVAFKDKNQNLWLFWASHQNKNSEIHYNQFDFDSANWGWSATSKRLTSGMTIDREPTALFFSDTDPNRKIWVFWSRKSKYGSNIYFSTKKDTDFTLENWSTEALFLDSPPFTNDPKIPKRQKYQNKQGFACLDNLGNIWCFWSSNREDGWNIYYKVFDKNTNSWSDEKKATSGYFSKKSPVALEDPAGNIQLFFSSNASTSYSSKVYSSTVTYDHRYVGSTSLDTNNAGKNSLQATLADVQNYTYDIGKGNENYYGRDTIGIFLYPNVENEQLINRGKEVVKGIFNRFMPIQLRAVFIITPFIYKDFIYTYEDSTIEPSRLIEEQFIDKYSSKSDDAYTGMSDTVSDRMLEWIRMHSWSSDFPGHRTVDFNAAVIETKYRTWHIGLEAEGN